MFRRGHRLSNSPILTVGVVSNHGKFTSDNHNKELRVLARRTWLSQFIDKLLLNPTRVLMPAREAFLASYSGKTGMNRFTKVRMDVKADAALRGYFATCKYDVETWFNVISPRGETLGTLQADLRTLAEKGLK